FASRMGGARIGASGLGNRPASTLARRVPRKWLTEGGYVKGGSGKNPHQRDYTHDVAAIRSVRNSTYAKWGARVSSRVILRPVEKPVRCRRLRFQHPAGDPHQGNGCGR